MTITASAQSVAQGETSLNVEIASGIRAVPDARVSVPIGERVVMNSRLTGNYIRWYKNQVRIEGATSSVYAIEFFTAADAGGYTARNEDPAAISLPLQTIRLSLAAPANRLLNFSGLVRLTTAQPRVINGWVVSGDQTKKILVRAVGPSLAGFGVSAPLAQPKIEIFDGQGKPYTEAYIYPAVVGGGYEDDVRESTRKAGAFALVPDAKDAVELRPFKAGSYTLHVTSSTGEAGAVLVEIYEVPE